MDKEKKISVIVVTYNQETTIARTLDSILMQQTDIPFEIVIGDDCSSDGTERICREYAAKFPDIIRYFRRERNLGVTKNYFQCIEDARGKYLADCAGDDFWVDATKLQRQYEEMEADPDVALVHTDWRCVDKDGRGVRESELFDKIERGKRQVYQPGETTTWVFNHDPRGMIHLCTAMYRKDMLMEELRKNPELFVSDEWGCEDLQIEVALSAKGKVVYLPSVTLYYSVYEGSISHTSDHKKIFKRLKGNLFMIERLRLHYGIDAECMRAYYLDQLQYLSAQAWHSKNRLLKREYRELKSILPPLPFSLKLWIKELL